MWPKTRVSTLHSRALCLPREALLASFRGEQVIGRSHRIRGVIRGPDSELVVLFLLQIQVVDAALKMASWETHNFVFTAKADPARES